MLPFNDLFTAQNWEDISGFYNSYDPAKEKMLFRQLPPQKVRTVFYGDSITYGFQIHEFFPGISFLNRGIPGDNLNGLYFRMDEDVFPYTPEQVVFMAGINGIEEDNAIMLKKYEAIGDRITQSGAKMYFCSVLPLRHGDAWDRFRFQNKIVELNGMLRELAERKFAGYIDYHSALKDAAGELAEAFARPDGTHIRFPGYQVMARVLAGKVRLK